MRFAVVKVTCPTAVACGARVICAFFLADKLPLEMLQSSPLRYEYVFPTSQLNTFNARIQYARVCLTTVYQEYIRVDVLYVVTCLATDNGKQERGVTRTNETGLWTIARFVQNDDCKIWPAAVCCHVPIRNSSRYSWAKPHL